MYSYIMSFEQKYYYVYIMASSKNGTLYIGFTSNLPQRIFEHKNHLLPGLPINTTWTSWFILNVLKMLTMQ